MTTPILCHVVNDYFSTCPRSHAIFENLKLQFFFTFFFSFFTSPNDEIKQILWHIRNWEDIRLKVLHKTNKWKQRNASFSSRPPKVWLEKGLLYSMSAVDHLESDWKRFVINKPPRVCLEKVCYRTTHCRQKFLENHKPSFYSDLLLSNVAIVYNWFKKRKGRGGGVIISDVICLL